MSTLFERMSTVARGERFKRTGKQVLEAGKHFADARDEAAAEAIVSALNMLSKWEQA